MNQAPSDSVGLVGGPGANFPPLSASSLSQLDRCPRLFRYLFIEQLPRPTGESQSAELRAEQGKRFHRLVELHTKGRVVDLLVNAAEPEVQGYWRTFCQSPHYHPPGQVFSELSLGYRLAGFDLIARLDRLLILPGQFQIYDWKTEQQRPNAQALSRSWQVRLYPLLLCLAGSSLNGGEPIEPEQVRMTIWFAQHPDEPFVYPYSRQQLQKDQVFLSKTLRQLQQWAMQGYPMTKKLETCSRCMFHARCYGLVPTQIDPEQAALYTWFAEPVAWDEG